MDGAYTTRLADPAQRVCRDCPTHCHCAVLESCLHVLDSVSADERSPEAMRIEESLRRRIRESGFAFPVGERRCTLADDPDEAERLIDAALAAVQACCRPPRDEDPTPA